MSGKRVSFSVNDEHLNVFCGKKESVKNWSLTYPSSTKKVETKNRVIRKLCKKDRFSNTQKVKKYLVRNSEQALPKKKIVHQDLVEEFPVYEEGNSQQKYKARYSSPELYSTLILAKRMRQISEGDVKSSDAAVSCEDEDKATISARPLVELPSMKVDVGKQLDFPLDQQLYTDLVTLDLNKKDKLDPVVKLKHTKKICSKKDTLDVTETSNTLDVTETSDTLNVTETADTLDVTETADTLDVTETYDTRDCSGQCNTISSTLVKSECPYSLSPPSPPKLGIYSWKEYSQENERYIINETNWRMRNNLKTEMNSCELCKDREAGAPGSFDINPNCFKCLYPFIVKQDFSWFHEQYAKDNENCPETPVNSTTVNNSSTSGQVSSSACGTSGSEASITPNTQPHSSRSEPSVTLKSTQQTSSGSEPGIIPRNTGPDKYSDPRSMSYDCKCFADSQAITGVSQNDIEDIVTSAGKLSLESQGNRTNYEMNSAGRNNENDEAGNYKSCNYPNPSTQTQDVMFKHCSGASEKPNSNTDYYLGRYSEYRTFKSPTSEFSNHDYNFGKSNTSMLRTHNNSNYFSKSSGADPYNIYGTHNFKNHSGTNFSDNYQMNDNEYGTAGNCTEDGSCGDDDILPFHTHLFNTEFSAQKSCKFSNSDRIDSCNTYSGNESSLKSKCTESNGDNKVYNIDPSSVYNSSSKSGEFGGSSKGTYSLGKDNDHNTAYQSSAYGSRTFSAKFQDPVDAASYMRHVDQAHGNDTGLFHSKSNGIFFEKSQGTEALGDYHTRTDLYGEDNVSVKSYEIENNSKPLSYTDACSSNRVNDSTSHSHTDYERNQVFTNPYKTNQKQFTVSDYFSNLTSRCRINDVSHKKSNPENLSENYYDSVFRYSEYSAPWYYGRSQVFTNLITSHSRHLVSSWLQSPSSGRQNMNSFITGTVTRHDAEEDSDEFVEGNGKGEFTVKNDS